jgi:hypothetical protein
MAFPISRGDLQNSKSKTKWSRKWWRIGVVVFVFFWIAVLYRVFGAPAASSKKFPIIQTDVGEKVLPTMKAAVSQYDHLVIVPGHSVIDVNQFFSGSVVTESAWKLLDYQEHQGLPEIISSHINAAINITLHDLRALLVFSGGQTRIDAGPISEGLSYYLYSKRLELLQSIEPRVGTEEFARDSFENLLFSICRFYEMTGVYPSRVTVVGFDFKMYRFRDLHRKAIKYPSTHFEYVPLDPKVPFPAFDAAKALAGEKAAYEAFEKDMYGCAKQSPNVLGAPAPISALRGANQAQHISEPPSGELLAKRLSRNPFHRTIPYDHSCPDIEKLLHWCGPAMFTGNSLPWN